MRTATDGAASLDVEGATVAELFSLLVAQYPGLKGQLIDETGTLHKFVNVYRNDDDIRYLDKLDTALSAGDTVSILPAVAGG
jgi:molybdopterin converting factor small subunit